MTVHYSVGDVPPALEVLHENMVATSLAYTARKIARHYADQRAALFFDAVEDFRRSLEQPQGGEQWDRVRVK